MSINLGNEGHKALAELRTIPAFLAFHRALGETADKLVDNSIGSDPTRRHEETSYARCARDLWVAIAAAMSGNHQRVVPARSTVGAAERPEKTVGKGRPETAPGGAGAPGGPPDDLGAGII